MNISIIIPVYNESEGIGKLFGCLGPFAEKSEIIFADGGSSDGTAQQIETWAQQQKKAAPLCYIAPEKGRANQMNYGASMSAGDVLWFLHADSVPPADALSQIQSIINKGYSAGCFRLRFDSRHPLLLYNSFMSNNVRLKIGKIAFGDQGIFITRALFDKLGGYAAIPIMEDYQLSIDVRNAGHSFGLSNSKITTSARRFKEKGPLMTMLWMQSLQHRFRRGDNIYEIAEAYYKR